MSDQPTQPPPFIDGPTVTLRFRSEDEKHLFMAGLCDGWGENYCGLHWPWKEGVKFHECSTFDVKYVWDPDKDGADE